MTILYNRRRGWTRMRKLWVGGSKNSRSRAGRRGNPSGIFIETRCRFGKVTPEEPRK